MTTPRATFWRRVLAHALEPTPYVWGGKRPGALDCSGLVTLSLWEASDGRIDWRDTINTDGLWKLPPVDVAAAKWPCASSATAPTVPNLRSMGSGTDGPCGRCPSWSSITLFWAKAACSCCQRCAV